MKASFIATTVMAALALAACQPAGTQGPTAKSTPHGVQSVALNSTGQDLATGSHTGGGSWDFNGQKFGYTVSLAGGVMTYTDLGSRGKSFSAPAAFAGSATTIKVDEYDFQGWPYSEVVITAYWDETGRCTSVEFTGKAAFEPPQTWETSCS